MSVQWQRPEGKGWGVVTIGQREVPARALVAVGGVVVWLGAALLMTGGEGIVAIWTNVALILGLVIIATATRTVSLHTLAWLFVMGGFMMGVTVLIAGLYAFLDPGQGARDVVVPLLEEVLKLAPVLYLLWRWRPTLVWSIGATDVLLMAAASGAGFSLVEDALIRSRFGWPDQLGWLPVTEIVGGRMIVGHGIWTALAGATLGIALLVRHRGWLVLPVAAAGFAWSLLDHISNNTGALGGLVAEGWLTVYLFLAAVVAVVGIDLYVRSRYRPVELVAPAVGSSLETAGAAWRFDVLRRALAYAECRRRNSSSTTDRAVAARVALALLRSLLQVSPRAEPSTRAAPA